jgi:tetratricopeptide (TPR) repeat protein
MKDEEALQSSLALGLSHQQAGRVAEAKEVYEQLLAKDRKQPDVLHMLGVIYSSQKEYQKAAELIGEAIALDPERAPFHHNLGQAYRQQDKYEEAREAYRQAVLLNPDEAESHFCLGNTHMALGAQKEALRAFQEALERAPNRMDIWSNLASTFLDMGEVDQAIMVFQRALALAPKDADMHYNLGTALLHNELYEEALLTMRTVLDIKPNHHLAWCNIGTALKNLGQTQGAAEAFKQSISLCPDYADAHWNQALLLLAQGDFSEGWKEYEWRRKIPSLRIRHQEETPWKGGDIAGKTILIHAEQGLGDTFQFLRYLRSLKAKGATVIFEAPPPLKKLLQSATFIDQLVCIGDALPEFDMQVPLMSLPWLLNPQDMDFASDKPWLAADPHLVELWGARLKGLKGKKVGLAWQGNPNYRADKARSLALRHFSTILELDNCDFISLQRDFGREQIEKLDSNTKVHDFAEELDREHGAFMDSAALLTQLDVLITSDTAMAHLAGALGVQVFLLLPHQPDWRWGTGGAHTAKWYPTMRPFVQTKAGDWAGVFAQVKAALSE